MVNERTKTGIVDVRNDDLEISSNIKTKFAHNSKVVIKNGYYAGYKGIIISYKQTLNGILYEIKCDELKDTLFIDEMNIKTRLW